ncbi:hypothetical protein OH146_04065 [Salinibacterium sp. SYSU T00001]|uniref:hypothetical protein n=1 Tax=Homoserinimonas sedimenticola TaxID=2986805 RepID=UPI002235950F|nr:hypothetical protein [Salinibacterium sedimenticola]MCW4384945.1 hypothetical protein [Salinibacterium sedimenticola]
MTTDAAATTPEAAKPGPRWLTIALAVLFGLFFAYDLFEALTNLFGAIELSDARNAFRVSQGLDPLAPPWVILAANVAAPVVAFAAAWWLGRKRRVGAQALLYLAGLAVVAAAALTFTALARTLL